MDVSTSIQLRNELPTLAGKFQLVAPKPQDSYWLTNNVFTQLVAIDVIPSDDKNLAPTFKAHFKITSLDNKSLWKFFDKRKRKFEAIIRRTIKDQSKGRLEVKEIQFYQGSIEVVVLFQLAIGLIGVYPEIKVIVVDLINISSSLLNAFNLFFLDYSIRKSTSPLTCIGWGILISIGAIIGFFVILILIIGALANSTQQPTYEPPTGDDSSEQQAGTRVNYSTQTTISIINNSLEEICYVYISPSSSDNWGRNWLGDSQTIPQDWSQKFIIEPGTYDLSVDNCDQNTIAETFNNDFRGDMEWVVE